MACLLKVEGQEFDVDAYLARGVLAPSGVYRRGEARFPTLRGARKSLRSGFNIAVSKKESSDFAGQVRDALGFLARHRRAIRALRRRKGVECATLEFGVERQPNAAVQAQAFPEELVRIAGELGLALGLSLYPAANPANR